MENQTLAHSSGSDICLTLVKTNEIKKGDDVVVPASRLLAYDQEMGFTRLKLIGGVTIEVKESTDQIDRMVRAASRNNPSSFAPTLIASGKKF